MAEKAASAKLQVVSSGSLAALAKAADATLVVAIGTYDAFAPAAAGELQKVLASSELQQMLKSTDKRILVAIGTYDAWPSPTKPEV